MNLSFFFLISLEVTFYHPEFLYPLSVIRTTLSLRTNIMLSPLPYDVGIYFDLREAAAARCGEEPGDAWCLEVKKL